MSASTKTWLGRAILVIVIFAIVAALIYLFATNESQQVQPSVRTATESIQPSQSTEANSPSSIVKIAYEAYVDKAYDEKTPNPEAALDIFKSNMTNRGRGAIAKYSKAKDPILCSEGRPEGLNYTQPTPDGSVAIITVISAMKEGTARAVVTISLAEHKIVRVSCE